MNARSRHVDVSRQQGAIADDHVVADYAVVPDVCRGHEVTFIADDRGALRFCAAMHRAVLAEDVPVADLQIAPAGPVELQVLRLMPDHRAHVDFVIASDFRVAGKVGVGQTRVPAPIFTCSSMTTFGPMSTDESISAFLFTIAVG